MSCAVRRPAGSGSRTTKGVHLQAAVPRVGCAPRGGYNGPRRPDGTLRSGVACGALALPPGHCLVCVTAALATPLAGAGVASACARPGPARSGGGADWDWTAVRVAALVTVYTVH